MERIRNYIGGEYQEPTNNSHFESFNPATGEAIAQIPESGVEDVNRAVGIAQEAFNSWRQTSFSERAQILRKISELIKENTDQLAALESMDQGKPIWLARELDIPRSAANFAFFAGAVEHCSNSATQEKGCLNYTWRDPIGTAGLITPWNLPLYLLTWKIAPALAMGNTVVCKPSELTSLTAHFLTRIFEQAGLPRGVCNILFGKGDPCGSSLVSHRDVPCLSFTGGTKTGLAIYKEGASHAKKMSLELGGKNPQFVFADCNIDACIEATLKAAFLNQGEICLCTSRLYVEEKIYLKFIERLLFRTKQIKTGDPRKEDSYLGALVSEEHLNKVLSYIDLAKQEGGSALIGGDRLSLVGELAKGSFMPPTILTGLSPRSRVIQEEIFGPVLCVFPFDSEDDLIKLGNDVPYGLSASIWTSNLSKAHSLAHALDVGQVWVNTWMKRDLRVPFGGVKLSGIGREGGVHSLDFFSQTKNVCIQF